MADNDITIKIKTVYDGAGADQAKSQMSSLSTQMGDNAAATSTATMAVDDMAESLVKTAEGGSAASKSLTALPAAAKKSAAASVPQIGLMTRAVTGYSKAVGWAGAAMGKLVAPLALISLAIESYNKIKNWLGWGDAAKKDADALGETAEAATSYAEALQASCKAKQTLTQLQASKAWQAQAHAKQDSYQQQLKSIQDINDAIALQLQLESIQSGGDFDAREAVITAQQARGEMSDTDAEAALLALRKERTDAELAREREGIKAAQQANAEQLDLNVGIEHAAHTASAKLAMPEGLAATKADYDAQLAVLQTQAAERDAKIKEYEDVLHDTLTQMVVPNMGVGYYAQVRADQAAAMAKMNGYKADAAASRQAVVDYQQHTSQALVKRGFGGPIDTAYGAYGTAVSHEASREQTASKAIADARAKAQELKGQQRINAANQAASDKVYAAQSQQQQINAGYTDKQELKDFLQEEIDAGLMRRGEANKLYSLAPDGMQAARDAAAMASPPDSAAAQNVSTQLERVVSINEQLSATLSAISSSVNTLESRIDKLQQQSKTLARR